MTYGYAIKINDLENMHCVRNAGVAGSNPTTPTKISLGFLPVFPSIFKSNHRTRCFAARGIRRVVQEVGMMVFVSSRQNLGRHAWQKDIGPHSRRAFSREFCQDVSPSSIRGRGECRMPDAPAASCAHGVTSMHTSIHSEPPETHRHSRTQWFYGLYRALPGDRLSCHRRLAEDGTSARLGVSTSARLDAGVEASGPHDFTVRISAVRQHAADRSQTEVRPAITCPA